MNNTQPEQKLLSLTDLQTIFTHFLPQDIEEFYQLYQVWSLSQKREEIIAQMQEITQKIAENDLYLKANSPSTIALATLSQFQANGVDDIDLLERMLARGDVWLDHTLELFERCQRLDMIQGNATEWCEHALDGAYEWIESMSSASEESDSTNDTDEDTTSPLSTIATDQPSLEEEIEALPETTEADFLQKLMSEDGEQLEEKESIDEQQTALAGEPEAEEAEATTLNTVNGENEEESNVQANIDRDEPFPQVVEPADEIPLSSVEITDGKQEDDETNTTETVLAQFNADEDTEYAITNPLLEVQNETEAAEPIAQDEQEALWEDQTFVIKTEKVAPITTSEPKVERHTEISSPESIEPEIENHTEVFSLESPELDSENHAEILPPAQNGPEDEQTTGEDKKVEQQEEITPFDGEKTQPITTIPRKPMHEEIEAQASEQQPTHATGEHKAPAETPTLSDEQAEYIREVAFAEAISGLETNTPAGLAAPDIEDILPPSTSNTEVTSLVEDNSQEKVSSQTHEEIKEEIRTKQVQSSQQDAEKKPPEQKSTKRRGFFQRLLAKLLRRR